MTNIVSVCLILQKHLAHISDPALQVHKRDFEHPTIAGVGSYSVGERRGVIDDNEAKDMWRGHSMHGQVQQAHEIVGDAHTTGMQERAVYKEVLWSAIEEGKYRREMSSVLYMLRLLFLRGHVDGVTHKAISSFTAQKSM